MRTLLLAFLLSCTAINAQSVTDHNRFLPGFHIGGNLNYYPGSWFEKGNLRHVTGYTAGANLEWLLNDRWSVGADIGYTRMSFYYPDIDIVCDPVPCPDYYFEENLGMVDIRFTSSYYYRKRRWLQAVGIDAGTAYVASEDWEPSPQFGLRWRLARPVQQGYGLWFVEPSFRMVFPWLENRISVPGFITGWKWQLKS